MTKKQFVKSGGIVSISDEYIRSILGLPGDIDICFLPRTSHDVATETHRVRVRRWGRSKEMPIVMEAAEYPTITIEQARAT